MALENKFCHAKTEIGGESKNAYRRQISRLKENAFPLSSRGELKFNAPPVSEMSFELNYMSVEMLGTDPNTRLSRGNGIPPLKFAFFSSH